MVLAKSEGWRKYGSDGNLGKFCEPGKILLSRRYEEVWRHQIRGKLCKSLEFLFSLPCHLTSEGQLIILQL